MWKACSLRKKPQRKNWQLKSESVLCLLTRLCSIILKWSEVAQSCPTLCNPMHCSLPGSSVHGTLQARILEWVAIFFSRGPSWLRDWTLMSCLMHLKASSLPLVPSGKPQISICLLKSYPTYFLKAGCFLFCLFIQNWYQGSLAMNFMTLSGSRRWRFMNFAGGGAIAFYHIHRRIFDSKRLGFTSIIILLTKDWYTFFL